MARDRGHGASDEFILIAGEFRLEITTPDPPLTPATLLSRGVSHPFWAGSRFCLEQFLAEMVRRGALRGPEDSITEQPRWEHGASEDADALGQPLHLVVLRREGPTEVPIGGQPRPGQRVLCHKLLPARVVTLVRDVPLAHLPLQLSEVQPRLVLLGPGEQGLACTEHGPERLSSARTLSALPVTSPGSMKVKPHPSQPAQPIEI